MGRKLCAQHHPPRLDDHDDMAALEAAAQDGNEDAFVAARHRIDWSQRPAPDWVRAVRLGLAAGAHMAARKLASEGAAQHPEHTELGKMACLLAPPRVVRIDLPPAPDVAANQAWLRAHTEEYKGRWVALRNGELLAAAATAGELKPYLERAEDVMITRVT